MITTGTPDSSRARAAAYIAREAELRAPNSAGSLAPATGSAAGPLGLSVGGSPREPSAAAPTTTIPMSQRARMACLRVLLRPRATAVSSGPLLVRPPAMVSPRPEGCRLSPLLRRIGIGLPITQAPTVL